MKTLKTLLIAAALVFSNASLADTEAHAVVAEAAKAPDSLTKAVAEELIERIKADRERFRGDADALYSMVDQVVLPHFDFELMSRLVLGKAWKKADEQVQQRFIIGFKNLLVRTYSNALLEYSNETIAWEEPRFNDEKDKAIVKSEIQAVGSAPIPMQYRLRKLGEAWKVYDVSVDSISLVTNYRGTYAAEIRKNGLEALVKKLES